MPDVVKNSKYLDDFIAEQESNPLAKALLHKYRKIYRDPNSLIYADPPYFLHKYRKVCRDSAIPEKEYSSMIRDEFEKFIEGE